MVKTILQLQGWAEELREATPYPEVLPVIPREDRMEKAILQLQSWSRGLKPLTVEIPELTPAEQDAILEGIQREDEQLEQVKEQVLLESASSTKND
jgi:hypothetical protein